MNIPYLTLEEHIGVYLNGAEKIKADIYAMNYNNVKKLSRRTERQDRKRVDGKTILDTGYSMSTLMSREEKEKCRHEREIPSARLKRGAMKYVEKVRANFYLESYHFDKNFPNMHMLLRHPCRVVLTKYPPVPR